MDQTLTSHMEAWLKDYIAEFRAVIARSAQEHAAHDISNLDDFSTPCQVHFFWFRHESIADCALLLCTRLKNLPDGLVKVVGPMAPPRMQHTLLEVLSWPCWDEKLDDPMFLRVGDGSVRFALAGLLATAKGAFLRHLEESVFSDMPRNAVVVNKSIFPGNGFSWQIVGDLCSLSVKELVDKSFREKKQAASATPPQQPQQKLPIPGFGTYFYPRLLVGEIPQPTPQEVLLRKDSLNPFRKAAKAFHTTYNGRTLVVNQDGYVGLEAKSKREAMEDLNVLMAAVLLSGISVTAVREVELGTIGIDSDSFTITSTSSGLVSLRTAPAFGGVGIPALPEVDLQLMQLQKRIVSEEKLRGVIARADGANNDPVARSYLLFLGEAYTHRFASEYRQSVVMAWLVIESWMEQQWLNMLGQKNLSQGRRDRFIAPDPWTAELRAETLNLLGLIDDTRLEKLTVARRKRNKVVHDGYNPTEGEADDILKLAIEVSLEATLKSR